MLSTSSSLESRRRLRGSARFAVFDAGRWAMVPFSCASAPLAVVYEKPLRLAHVFVVAIVEIPILGLTQGSRPVAPMSKRKSNAACVPRIIATRRQGLPAAEFSRRLARFGRP
ncbi:hypothetical protein PCL_07376 [Purpureocillium lilacinum]|uniref:Uncharacterized protein n=1 Tax=Purpureocillium lilacinum TaxID=33203 RepID=A0A2U3DS45_PURLI|nr:hypothetical protein PCL_07376 [Purpureocillium lilacinum]